MKEKLLIYFVFFNILLFGFSAQAQQTRTITGIVTDNAKEPLSGVTVSATGANVAVQTGTDGRFEVIVPRSSNSLTFSSVGYIQQVKTISANSGFLTIVMEKDDQVIDDVVVTALGITRKRNELPYAAQSVGGEELTRTRDNNFTNALSGKIAGLDIKQSGTMGGSTNVVMRGFKSMTGNNQALFVIDGVPVSNAVLNDADAGSQDQGRGGYDYGNAVADINPDDIESITTLKGAAASALYGSRAANGVIMITTKKGRKNSTNITTNNGITIGNIDKSTFPTYQKEYGAGYVPSYGSADGNFWYRETSFSNGNLVELTPFTEDASYGAAFDPNRLIYQWASLDPTSPTYGVATPWTAAENDPSTFYETSINSMQSIMLDGGGDKTTYKFGYTRNDETGVLPNSRITKNLFNFSGSHEITDNLVFSSTANYSGISGLGRYGTGYDGRNVNQTFRQWWQTNADIQELENAYYRTGNNTTWNWSDETGSGPIYANNPYWERFNNYETDTRNRYYGNIVLNWKPLDWLNVMGRVTYDGSNDLQQERIAIGSQDIPMYSRYQRVYSEVNYDLLLNFNKNISEDISFNGLLGSNMRRNYISSVFAETNGGLIYEGLYSLNNSVNAIEAPVETLERIGLDGYFASANFGYKETVFLEGTIRRDQSTTLPAGNNVYWYPAVSGSLVFSKLLKNTESWLDLGKLRANYAEVGNDAPALSVYQTYAINPVFNGNALASVNSALLNQNLLPERTKSYEFGLEMSFLRSRLGFDFTYYNAVSEDQIMPAEISSATGYGSFWVNAGSIRNRGFEVSAFVVPVRTADFSWTMNLNFSRNRNTVLSLYDDNENLLLGDFQGGVTINATVGQPFGTIRGQDYVYYEDTDERLVDESGYYVFGAANQVLGDINPDWMGGIQNTFKYKNISLNFLVDMKFGGDVFSLDQYYGMATGIYPETAGLNDLGNPQRAPLAEGGGVILDGRTEDGSVNTTRIATDNFLTSPYGYTNNPVAGYVYDASYVKLRELGITYSFPESMLAKTKLFKGADLSFIARNLWIIHKNVPYADPEFGLGAGNLQGIQSGVYPAVRSFGFNLKMRF